VLGIAAAAMAVVLAIGFVVAANQGGDTPVAGVQRAHPQVSDALEARRQWLKEQAALKAEPTVNPGIQRAEQYQEFLEDRAQQAAAARTFSPEAHRHLGTTDAGSITVNPEIEKAWAYMNTVNSKAQTPRATWDQRFDDMNERFQNQYDGGSELTPLLGRS
jgi:hypothetical protein